MEFDFDIKDIEHEHEIKEQLWVMTGERNCKVNWWNNFDLLLRVRKAKHS